MDNIIKLPFIDQLKSNLSHNDLIQVVIGPRQVGKTTTIKTHLLNDKAFQGVYFSADGVFNSDANWLTEIWQNACSNYNLIIIDEIQKVENWSETIKRLWDLEKDKDSPLKCILLGSSSLQIQKGLTESLTGRFQLTRVFHWNYIESYSFNALKFDEYLKIGGYPGSYKFNEINAWSDYVKNSIVSTIIEKDILLYNKVKSPSLFKQAFDMLMNYPCHEISYTKLLGQLQDKGNVDLIKYYIKLYEGAFLIKALEKFSHNQLKLKASSPKIIVLAPSLYYLNIKDDYTSEEKGYVFEALVGAQLLRTGEDLFYWRKGDFEIDFVLKKGRKIFAIEVKSGKKRKAKSLTKFLEQYPKAKPILITEENYFEFEENPLNFLEN